MESQNCADRCQLLRDCIDEGVSCIPCALPRFWTHGEDPSIALIECRSVSKDWAGTRIITEASFSIDPGEKVGLIGLNGSGKSSLLCILAGLDEDYQGSIVKKPGLRVALVPQRFEPQEGLSCLEILLAPARSLETRLEGKSEELGLLSGRALDRALVEYGELRAAYELLGAEGAAEGASRLLDRLGLADIAGRETRLLSGGEKNVLALGAALATEPELILLDEPGNHLDFGGLAWLEEFIVGERRAILLVSHERWLLDRSVGRILELDRCRITPYAGGYSSWRRQKLAKEAGQGRDWQADRKRIEGLEALVARFAEIARAHPDPAWGKRLRARRSQLARQKEEAAEKPASGTGASPKRMRINFDGEGSKADFALIVRDYRKAYGERLLLDGASMDILVGERVGIVGPNGSGKTSLLRDIVAAAGEGQEGAGGAIRVGPSMRVGYCAQEQELFNAERTVGQEFAELGARDAETKGLLRRFLFDHGITSRLIGELSGGERNRLQIARAVWLGANFLILDEPTNHLDIPGREAVEEGLADFEGTILVVSHDRWFLEKTADRLLLLEDRKFVPYEGGFSEYWRDIGKPTADAARRAATRTRGEEALAGRGGAVARSRQVGRNKSTPARLAAGNGPGAGDGARTRELERRIGLAEAKRAELEGEAEAALSSRDFARAGRLAAQAGDQARLIDRLYEEWGGRA